MLLFLPVLLSIFWDLMRPFKHFWIGRHVFSSPLIKLIQLPSYLYSSLLFIFSRVFLCLQVFLWIYSSFCLNHFSNTFWWYGTWVCTHSNSCMGTSIFPVTQTDDLVLGWLSDPEAFEPFSHEPLVNHPLSNLPLLSSSVHCVWRLNQVWFYFHCERRGVSTFCLQTYIYFSPFILPHLDFNHSMLRCVRLAVNCSLLRDLFQPDSTPFCKSGKCSAVANHHFISLFTHSVLLENSLGLPFGNSVYVHLGLRFYLSFINFSSWSVCLSLFLSTPQPTMNYILCKTAFFPVHLRKFYLLKNCCEIFHSGSNCTFLRSVRFYSDASFSLIFILQASDLLRCGFLLFDFVCFDILYHFAGASWPESG